MLKLYFRRVLAYIGKAVVVTLVPLILATCSAEDEGATVIRVRSVATVLDLTGDPTTARTLPAISEAKAQLGMKLFFSKGLSGDQDTACASCHHPALGGDDNLSLPIGVGADNEEIVGPGRTHPSSGPTVPRNAPTTFNTGLLDQVMFHDGRVESIGKTVGLNGGDGLGIVTPDSEEDTVGNKLADPDAGDNLPTAQSRFEVISAEEMRGFTFPSADPTNDEVRTALAAQLASYQGWLDEFAAVYGDTTITYERIAEAIGEYERSQVFVQTPWKAFLDGDDTAISEAARRGALLFMLPTRANGASCISCHRGDRFTDERFHVLGIPQIGRGKGDGDTLTDDFGRFRVTGNDADLYAFRTPSLLNVTENGPWGHSGAYTTLEGIIRHHLDPQTAFDNYDVTQLETSIVDSGQTDDMQFNTQNALDKLETNRLSGIFSIPNVELTDDEVSDLVEFLKTLTDPCVTDRNCVAPWIPDSDYIDANPDLQLLKAVDQSLNPL